MKAVENAISYVDYHIDDKVYNKIFEYGLKMLNHLYDSIQGKNMLPKDDLACSITPRRCPQAPGCGRSASVPPTLMLVSGSEAGVCQP